MGREPHGDPGCGRPAAERSSRGRWSLGPDALVRLSRQARCGDQAGATLVRWQNDGRVPRDRDARRRRDAAAELGVQPRAGRLHPAQGAVAAQSRAGGIRATRHGAPRQGFRALASDGLDRDGAVRRLRHAHVRSRSHALEPGDSRRGRSRAITASSGGWIGRSARPGHQGSCRRYRARRRHTGRGGRRG